MLINLLGITQFNSLLFPFLFNLFYYVFIFCCFLYLRQIFQSSRNLPRVMLQQTCGLIGFCFPHFSPPPSFHYCHRLHSPVGAAAAAAVAAVPRHTAQIAVHTHCCCCCCWRCLDCWQTHQMRQGPPHRSRRQRWELRSRGCDAANCGNCDRRLHAARPSWS